MPVPPDAVWPRRPDAVPSPPRWLQPRGFLDIFAPPPRLVGPWRRRLTAPATVEQRSSCRLRPPGHVGPRHSQHRKQQQDVVAHQAWRHLHPRRRLPRRLPCRLRRPSPPLHPRLCAPHHPRPSGSRVPDAPSAPGLARLDPPLFQDSRHLCTQPRLSRWLLLSALPQGPPEHLPRRLFHPIACPLSSARHRRRRPFAARLVDHWQLQGPLETLRSRPHGLRLFCAKQIANAETVCEEDLDYVHPYGLDPSLPDVRGSVAAQYIPVESRPYHRPLGNFRRRADTIRWTRNRLRELNQQIFKLRRQVRRGDGDTLPAAFLEFETQESAQAAHQVVAHHRPLHMSSRILGIHPDEVLWKSLMMSWWERIIRKFIILSLVTVAVIFWSVPSALIGFISQIDFLAKNIIFLDWVKQLPTVVVSFIQSFVPSLALSLWMAAVPVMLRVCGAQAGIPSVTMVELFVQKTYFAFQVVQVFLVTTLTSAASAAFTKILENPLQAKDVLATNLPMASNFYLSYILIQCLMSSGTNIMQIFSLIRHHVLSRLSTLPRAQFRTWRRMQPARWGGVFPIYTNMGVIATSYACIAPLILIFAAGGMAVTRVVWRYKLIFVLDSGLDSKGLFYPHALLHLTIGLYLAEICLIGLFALHLSFGPLAIMVIFIFTGLVHVSLSDAIAPLLQNLPQTLSLEEIQREEKEAAERARELATARPTGDGRGAGAASSYFDPEQAFGEDDARGDNDEDAETEDDEATVTNDRAIEGASGVRSALTEWIRSSTKSKVQAQVQSMGLGAASPDGCIRRYTKTSSRSAR